MYYKTLILSYIAVEFIVGVDSVGQACIMCVPHLTCALVGDSGGMPPGKIKNAFLLSLYECGSSFDEKIMKL